MDVDTAEVKPIRKRGLPTAVKRRKEEAAKRREMLQLQVARTS